MMRWDYFWNESCYSIINLSLPQWIFSKLFQNPIENPLGLSVKKTRVMLTSRLAYNVCKKKCMIKIYRQCASIRVQDDLCLMLQFWYLPEYSTVCFVKITHHEVRNQPTQRTLFFPTIAKLLLFCTALTVQKVSNSLFPASAAVGICLN